MPCWPRALYRLGQPSGCSNATNFPATAVGPTGVGLDPMRCADLGSKAAAQVRLTFRRPQCARLALGSTPRAVQPWAAERLLQCDQLSGREGRPLRCRLANAKTAEKQSPPPVTRRPPAFRQGVVAILTEVRTRPRVVSMTFFRLRASLRSVLVGHT